MGPDVLGGYAGVYEWIATSILKGGRTPHQVRAFAETIFNARKKRTRPQPGGEKLKAAEQKDSNLQGDNEDNENEGEHEDSDTEHDLV